VKGKHAKYVRVLFAQFSYECDRFKLHFTILLLIGIYLSLVVHSITMTSYKLEKTILLLPIKFAVNTGYLSLRNRQDISYYNHVQVVKYQYHKRELH
jgi:hypothetical protein